MLETLRAYAAGLLAGAGEDARVAAALAGWALAVAEEASAGLQTVEEKWLRPNADGTTAAPFQNAIDGSAYDGTLNEATWLVGWVPPAVGLCGKAADYKPAASSGTPAPGPQPEFPEIGMYFTAASAVAGTITGSIYNFQTGQSKGAQAAGILANVSNVVAPFLTSEAIDVTDGISVPAKLILDAAANMGAAVAMLPS